MKVLFLGEYSGVYWELSKGLKEFGVNTYRISDGDGFKSYPADFILPRPFKVRFKLLKKISFLLGINNLWYFFKVWPILKKKLKGFDIVQLNNPRFFCFGDLINLYIVHYVAKNNAKIYMSVLGDDYYVDNTYIKYDNKMPMYKLNRKKIRLRNMLWGKYIADYIVSKCTAIIAPPGKYYKLSYDWTNKTTEPIPFACSEDKIGEPFSIKENDVIVIFHGWQKGKELRKGNDIFDRVLKKVKIKYGEKVEYQVVRNVPFAEYYKMFSKCHIFIDQLYASDKGTNGMYGLARGKVVFSGFDKNILSMYPFYKGEEIGVSASANEEELFKQFCDLIDNPRRMESISKNAIEFARKNHASKIVAKMYMDVWSR